MNVKLSDSNIKDLLENSTVTKKNPTPESKNCLDDTIHDLLADGIFDYRIFADLSRLPSTSEFDTSSQRDQILMALLGFQSKIRFLQTSNNWSDFVIKRDQLFLKYLDKCESGSQEDFEISESDLKDFPPLEQSETELMKEMRESVSTLIEIWNGKLGKRSFIWERNL